MTVIFFLSIYFVSPAPVHDLSVLAGKNCWGEANLGSGDCVLVWGGFNSPSPLRVRAAAHLPTAGGCQALGAAPRFGLAHLQDYA